MNSKHLLGLSAVLALGLLFYFTRSTGERPEHLTGVSPLNDAPNAELAGASAIGYDEEGVMVWREDGYRQRLYVTGFALVEVVDEFYHAPSDSWIETRNHGSASYQILHVESAGPDVFVCGGFSEDGDVVLERWKLNRIGIPQLDDVPYGTIPPAPPTVGFRKVEVYRGPLATNLYGIGLDPQGRYMLALTGTDQGADTLYKLALQASSTPVVVRDTNSLPELSQVYHLKLMDHVQLGRSCVLDAGYDGDFQIILADSQNDGVFEAAPIVGDYPYFTQLGLDTYEDWDAFMHP